MAFPILVFDYNTHPQLADNIWQAQMAGHPQVLTYNGPDIVTRRQTRRDAMHYDDGQNVGEIPRILSRDEYPFACTVQGGRSAWVGHIPGGENSAQGGLIAAFLRQNNITATQNSTFIVRVINHPRGPVDDKVNEALRQLVDKRQTLWNLYQLYSSEHQKQLDLATNSIAGFFVSQFNGPAPPTAIWTNAYGRLLATQRYIAQRDVVRATSSLLIGRLWYLYAMKRYTTWKDGIEAAGKSAERAIWATAATVVVVTVGACLAAGALTGWAGWGAANTAAGAASGTAGAEQTLARIAAACANADRVIRVADAAIEEDRILEAIAEAEREAAVLGG